MCSSGRKGKAPPTDAHYLHFWAGDDNIPFHAFLNLEVPASDCSPDGGKAASLVQSDGVAISQAFIHDKLVPYCIEHNIRH